LILLNFVHFLLNFVEFLLKFVPRLLVLSSFTLQCVQTGKSGSIAAHATNHAQECNRIARKLAEKAVAAVSKATCANRKDLDAFRKLSATLELVLLKFIHQFLLNFVQFLMKFIHQSQLKSFLCRKELILQLFRLKFTLNCVRTEKCGSHAVPAMVHAQKRNHSAQKCVNRKAVVAVSKTMFENQKDTVVST